MNYVCHTGGLLTMSRCMSAIIIIISLMSLSAHECRHGIACELACEERK